MTYDTTLQQNPKPKIMPAGTIGGWVRVMQEQVCRDNVAKKKLPGKSPLSPTGAHEEAWLDYVRGLRLIWGLSDSGDIDTEFAKAYETETGIKFLPGDYFPNAPTIARVSDSERRRRLFRAHSNTQGSKEMLVVAEYPERHRRPDGSDLNENGYREVKSVATFTKKTGGRIILLKRIREYEHGELHEWKSAWHKLHGAGFQERSPQQPIEVGLDEYGWDPRCWRALALCLGQPLTLVVGAQAKELLETG